MHVVLLCAGSTSIAQHLFPIYIVDINEYQNIQRNKKASKNNTLDIHYSSSVGRYLMEFSIQKGKGNSNMANFHFIFLNSLISRYKTLQMEIRKGLTRGRIKVICH